jgi:hypothetical protein
MRRDNRLSLEQTKRISKARLLGQGRALSIFLEDGEIAKLIGVIEHDVGAVGVLERLADAARPTQKYYNTDTSWFSEIVPVDDFVGLYLEAVEKIKDFETFFECLCELHKRRRKYDAILSTQPFPTMLQVSPRSLLEFGIVSTPALASWLSWRKWFYDIDNRAAQETGYLFEPILASALGGIPYGAKKSPVKRVSDHSKGRQVDCIVGRDAYEFKLRVTIAASGQGRFGEELDFARDCQASGYVPILLVLDPTPNNRLDDLIAEFEKYGGRAYIGDAAWHHLETEAGDTMGAFIENYVRTPIAEIDGFSQELLDLTAKVDTELSQISLRLEKGEKTFDWSIPRQLGEEAFDED